MKVPLPLPNTSGQLSVLLVNMLAVLTTLVGRTAVVGPVQRLAAGPRLTLLARALDVAARASAALAGL